MLLSPFGRLGIDISFHGYDVHVLSLYIAYCQKNVKKEEIEGFKLSADLFPPKRSIKHSKRKLEQVLEPYLAHWDKWIHSNGCFLTKEEMQAITFYRKYGSHQVLANELKVPASWIGTTYNRALHRLVTNEHLYKHWKDNKTMEKKDLKTNLTPVEAFLRTPMHEHGFSKPLYLILSGEAETLEKLLANFTEADLLKLQGFEAEQLSELKKVLWANNCITCLRKF